MEHLDCPHPDIWEARRQWFEALGEETSGNASYFVSEQACALTARCTGSFLCRRLGSRNHSYHGGY